MEEIRHNYDASMVMQLETTAANMGISLHIWQYEIEANSITLEMCLVAPGSLSIDSIVCRCEMLGLSGAELGKNLADAICVRYINEHLKGLLENAEPATMVQ